MTSETSSSGDFHRYQLELERVRLIIARLTASNDKKNELDEELLAIRATLDKISHRGRAADLQHRLALQPVDMELLWASVATGHDPTLQGMTQPLGGLDSRKGLSLSLFARLFEQAPALARTLTARISGGHPLFQHNLLEWSKDTASLSARHIVVPEGVVAWLSGGKFNHNVLTLLSQDELEFDLHQATIAATLPDILDMPEALLIVEGPQSSGKRALMGLVARKVGRLAIALDASRLITPDSLAASLLELRRECLLRSALPVIANLDSFGQSEEARKVAQHLVSDSISQMSCPVLVTVRDPSFHLLTRRPVARVRWRVPDSSTRTDQWHRQLGSHDIVSDHLTDIGRRYQIGAGAIRQAIASARLHAGEFPLRASHLTQGVRSLIAENLGELAMRQDVSQSWNDLVLAPDIRDQVTMLVARIRHANLVLDQWGYSAKLAKGTGVAALFSGPPGTGKTMVAGLIAKELDLELYQVDLSKVVSKWVGETEKQLARIFEAAEAGHALLLFDEADSLFAKRTDVKSAVDRYANLEVNYLLQRIESFGGISILTTNLEASIDPALRRRLAASIAFWPPDEAEREALWVRMLESRAPKSNDIDIPALARDFDEMTGANIRNGVLSAAFLAASETSPITQAHLVRGARAEYASMGRVLGKR